MLINHLPSLKMYLKNKTAKLLTVSYLFFGILSPSLAQNQLQPEPPVAKYNVSWDSLGNYSADSMPLGNGDIGLNLWTEQNGDVLFYISKTDALLENASPVKLAKIIGPCTGRYYQMVRWDPYI